MADKKCFTAKLAMKKFFLKIKSSLLENKTGKQTVFKNTFWLIISEFFDKGVAFLVGILIARHFGPSTYGQWTFALGFVGLFTIFADFGLNTLTVRDLAQNKKKTGTYIDNILATKIFLGTLTFAAIFFAANFLNVGKEILPIIYLLGVYTIINTFGIFFRSVFQANEKMQYDTITRIVQDIILFLFVLVFILNKKSIIEISYAYIIAAIAGAIFSLIFTWIYFSKFFNKIDLGGCKELLIEAWPLAFAGIFVSIYSQADILLLKYLANFSAVGIYDAANGIASNLTILPALLVGAAYPRLSNLFMESKNNFMESCKKLFKIILIMDLIIIPLFFILSKPLIFFLYGASYNNSAIVFKILLCSSFFAFLNSLLNYILFVVKKQKQYSFIIFICFIFNIIFNILLIPKFSYSGAAIATVFSQLLQFILLFTTVKKEFKKL